MDSLLIEEVNMGGGGPRPSKHSKHPSGLWSEAESQLYIQHVSIFVWRLS